MTEKKLVMVFGTFDHLHPGHRYFLREAKRHGDFLIVVVARDKTVKQLKGKYPDQKEKTRLNVVKNLENIDEAILGNKGGDKFEVIRKIRPATICLGYDQHYFADELEKELNRMGLESEVVRLKSYKPHKYKTSIIKGKKNGKSG